MKSRLTSNPNRLAIAELADLLFIPTSFLRIAHTNVQEGRWNLKVECENSKLAQVLPYIGAYFYETARLYGYYKLAEALIS